MQRTILHSVGVGMLLLVLAAGSASACTLPQVVSFDATNTNLATAGSTTLGWVTTGTSVQITPGSGTLKPNGQINVSVASTTIYTLKTTNACGSVSAPLTIAVGKPFLKSISPTSAAPGDLVTVVLGNIGGPIQDALDGIYFSNSSTPIPIAGAIDHILPNGNVVVRVPVLLADTTAGYVTGSVTVNAGVFGKSTGKATFTITPLSYSGNAPSDFLTLVQNAVNNVKNQLATLQGVSGFSTAAKALSSFADSYSALLTNMAKEVATKGTATMPIDLPSTAQPNPPTITLTTQDFATFLALYTKYAPIPKAASVVNRPASLPPPIDYSTSPYCLADPTGANGPNTLLYGACRTALSFFDNAGNEAVKNWITAIGAIVNTVQASNFLKLSRFTSVGTMVSVLFLLSQDICHVAPISLGNVTSAQQLFSFEKNPFPKSPGQTFMDVTLVSDWTSSKIGQELTDDLTFKFHSAEEADKVDQAIENLNEYLKLHFQKSLENLTQNITGKLPNEPLIWTPQVDACDIVESGVQPPRLSPIVKRDTDTTYGLWAFDGLNEGTTVITIPPISGHWMGNNGDDLKVLTGSNVPTFTAPFCVVQCTGLTINSPSVNADGSAGSDPGTIYIVAGSRYFLVPSSPDPKGGTAALLAKQISDTKWQVTVTDHEEDVGSQGCCLTAVTAGFNFTAPAGHSVKITVDYSVNLNSSSPCQATYVFDVSGSFSSGQPFDFKDNNESQGCPSKVSFQNKPLGTQQEPATSLGGSLNLRGDAGGGGYMNSMTITFDVI